MRNPRRLTAAAILTLAAVIAPLSGQASDDLAAQHTDPRYGNCKYGTAAGIDRALQVCSKVTIYLVSGQAQSRHLVNMGGTNVQGGSYTFQFLKRKPGLVDVYVLNETSTFGPRVAGGFSAERVSGFFNGATASDGSQFIAISRLTIGTHVTVVSQTCTFPAGPGLEQIAYCLGTQPLSPYA